MSESQPNTVQIEIETETPPRNPLAPPWLKGKGTPCFLDEDDCAAPDNIGIAGDKICDYCIGYPIFKLVDLANRARNPNKEAAKNQLLQVQLQKNLTVVRASKRDKEMACAFTDPNFDQEHFKKFICPEYLPHPCENIDLSQPGLSDALPGVLCCTRCWEENREEYWFQELFHDLGPEIKHAKMIFLCVFWRTELLGDDLWQLALQMDRPDECVSQDKGPEYMCDPCRNALRDGAGPGRWNKKYPWLPEHFKESGELRKVRG